MYLKYFSVQILLTDFSVFIKFSSNRKKCYISFLKNIIKYFSQGLETYCKWDLLNFPVRNIDILI